MENKICVYAICKNESKFVDEWLSNMSEADYIVVLDTGSEDGTFEMLKNDPRVTRVEQKIIKPWRFDVARNESMKLCLSTDANILMCTDFDEKFEPGWADQIRAEWKEDTCRCFYWYAWSHNERGMATDVFKYDKCHDRDHYRWKYPVHEVLDVVDGFTEYIEKTINIQSVKLHHYPDNSKQRFYFEPLKLAVKENPKDPHPLSLLAREYSAMNQLDEAEKCFLKVLKMPMAYEDSYKEVLVYTYYMLAKINAVNMKDLQMSVYYLNMFLKVDKTFRDPYLMLADIYNTWQMYDIAVGYIEQMDKLAFQHYSWVEDTTTWINRREDILGIAYLGLGRFKEAQPLLQKAVDCEPTNVRLLQNYIICLQNVIKEIENG